MKTQKQEQNGLLKKIVFLCVGFTFLLGNFAWAWLPTIDGTDETKSGAHITINQKAVDSFLNGLNKKGDFQTSPIDNVATFTGLWQKPDWAIGMNIDLGVENNNEKIPNLIFQECIMHGGQTADYPAIKMSQRHFYNPKTGQALSDKKNGPVDAVTWGIEGTAGTDTLLNNHSFAKALILYKAAMENNFGGLDPTDYGSDRSAVFAAAFRALGETLHLSGDMCLPTHVRNDAHGDVGYIGFAGTMDPIEGSTYQPQVVKALQSSGFQRPDFSALSARQILESCAKEVNEAFFSKSTIQDSALKITPENGQTGDRLEKPSFSELTLEGNRYYRTFRGIKVPICEEKLSSAIIKVNNSGLTGTMTIPTTKYFIPNAEDFVQGQDNALIPLAVYACEEIIKRFFPTITLTLDSPKVESNGSITLIGTMDHLKENTEWSSLPKIRYNGPGTLVLKDSSGKTTSEISVEFLQGAMTKNVTTLKVGEKVQLVVKAGGRVFTSKEETIPAGSTTNPTALAIANALFTANINGGVSTFNSFQSALNSGCPMIPGLPHLTNGFTGFGKILAGSRAKTKAEAVAANISNPVVVADPYGYNKFTHSYTTTGYLPTTSSSSSSSSGGSLQRISSILPATNSSYDIVTYAYSYTLYVKYMDSTGAIVALDTTKTDYWYYLPTDKTVDQVYFYGEMTLKISGSTNFSWEEKTTFGSSANPWRYQDMNDTNGLKVYGQTNTTSSGTYMGNKVDSFTYSFEVAGTDGYFHYPENYYGATVYPTGYFKMGNTDLNVTFTFDGTRIGKISYSPSIPAGAANQVDLGAPSIPVSPTTTPAPTPTTSPTPTPTTTPTPTPQTPTTPTPGYFSLSVNSYWNANPPAGPAAMLTWTSSSNATSYDVYRNGSLYWSDITGNSFDNNTNLTSGQSYTYFVRAKNTSGTKDSSSKTITALYSPTPIITERLINGNFDSGTYPWALSGDFWIGNSSNYYSSPNYAAGGVDSGGSPKNSAYGIMSQPFTIPTNATTAILKLKYNVTSKETGYSPTDVLNVTIRDSSNTVLDTVLILTNLNKTSAANSYTPKTLDLTHRKGQTLKIHFLATTNSANSTVFRIDDLSVMSDGN